MEQNLAKQIVENLPSDLTGLEASQPMYQATIEFMDGQTVTVEYLDYHVTKTILFLAGAEGEQQYPLANIRRFHLPV